jgi:hypothetical protein
MHRLDPVAHVHADDLDRLHTVIHGGESVSEIEVSGARR